jgi:membrane protease YdiL (CAAX protease family)
LQILITAYILFFIGFAIYFTLLYSRTRVERFFEKKWGTQKAITFYVGLEKFSGFVLMMLLPLSVLAFFKDFDTKELGIEFTNPAQTFMWWGILGAVVLTVNLIRAGKPANYNLYPQIRTQEWSASLLGYYVLGWALYLLGYEFLFRGILFFAGANFLPLWLNITINTVLYAVAHLPKGKLEIIASVPFGVVLCLISYNTGNFWAAWLIHLTLALSNSLIALMANPQMTVNLKKF